MNIADVLAFLSFAAIIGLLCSIPIAAFKGRGKLWFYELLALMVALGGLASLQYAGRGAFLFNLMAIAVLFAACLFSVPSVFLGRFLRTRNHNPQVKLEG